MYSVVCKSTFRGKKWQTSSTENWKVRDTQRLLERFIQTLEHLLDVSLTGVAALQQWVWIHLWTDSLRLLVQTQPNRVNQKKKMLAILKGIANVSTWKHVCPVVTPHCSLALGNSGLSWPHQVSWLSFYRPLGAVVNFKMCVFDYLAG